MARCYAQACRRRNAVRVGLYIATLFVVWQIVNYLVFHTAPTPPVFFGGALIIAGGLIVSFWGQPPES